MQEEAYRLMAALEREHWWYRGRRLLLRRLLERLDLPPGSRLLEVGVGSGGNLETLAAFGRVFGVEPSATGATLGRASWAGRVALARAPDLPFPDRSFDLVAALDVLEHLHNDLDGLDEMHRLLRPGGHLLLYVPAFQLLWGHEDVASGHHRRYRRGQVARLLAAAGFEAVHLGYVTTLLFPAIAAVKVLKRLLLRGGPPRPDVAGLPPRLINDALAALAEAEAEVAAAAEMPIGASIVALARRR